MPIIFNEYVVEGKHMYRIENTIKYTFLNFENKCFVANLNKIVEPKGFKEASLDPNWVNAMNDEMEALYQNHTWIITKLPKNRKAI